VFEIHLTLGASTRAAISTGSCSDPTGQLAKNSLLRCDSFSDDSVTGEGSLTIVEISEEGVYVVTAAVVASVVVAGVVVAAVVVNAEGVESRLLAVVVVFKDASKSIALLSTTAMLLIDGIGLSVIS